MLRRDTDADQPPISTNCLQSLKDKIYIIALDDDNGDTFIIQFLHRRFCLINTKIEPTAGC